MVFCRLFTADCCFLGALSMELAAALGWCMQLQWLSAEHHSMRAYTHDEGP